MFLYYCVLKKYKGIFKKRHAGNSHILYCPLPNGKTLILGLVGKIEGEDDLYSSVLVYMVPTDVVDDIVLRQMDEFGWKFERLDKILVSVTGTTTKSRIRLLEKSQFIKTNLSIEFDPDHSQSPVYIFFISGKFNFMETEMVGVETDMRMVAMKKRAVTKSILKKSIITRKD